MLAIAVCAPGCQLVFTLEEVVDVVPHVATEDEAIGVGDVTLQQVTINTTGDAAIPNGTIGQATLAVVRQEPEGGDLVVLRADHLTIDGELLVEGARPLVLIARTIEITATGKISAQARGDIPGNNGGIPGGEGGGGPGRRDGAAHTGGGGGGFATPGGEGGIRECAGVESTAGGGGGLAIGEPRLRVLVGGGAGGFGGTECGTAAMPPGAGGGAIQLSALESILLASGSQIRVDGGGGKGGVSCSRFQDAGGSGGGAGGAIYLDAPTIENRGMLAANGGSGGGAGDFGDFGTMNNGTGGPGVDGSTSFAAVAGGGGNPPRGTSGGGAGASEPPASGASSTSCIETNTGGGGGAAGRIVLRGAVTLMGQVSPDPTILPR